MTSLNGQWLGYAKGTNEAEIIINLDEYRGTFRGTGYVWDRDPQLPSFALTIELDFTGDAFIGKGTPLAPINARTKELMDWQSFTDVYPNAAIPHQVHLSAKIKDDILEVEWKSEAETYGTARLRKGKAGEPSAYKTTKLNWSEFKNFALKMGNGDFIYRGQAGPWRLRTSLHRNGRFDINRYSLEDVQTLTRYLSAASSHVFEPADARQHGALLSLAQHHGYPTPLLDWTASPFIAAFFAFDDINDYGNDHVRVFALNRTKWQVETPFARDISHPELTISIYDMTPIKNNRMIPQQSVTTVSNVDDIESFIQTYEEKNNESYLQIFELPKSNRTIAIRDLRMMGITYGSMFPGLDGVCRDLKDRYF